MKGAGKARVAVLGEAGRAGSGAPRSCRAGGSGIARWRRPREFTEDLQPRLANRVQLTSGAGGRGDGSCGWWTRHRPRRTARSTTRFDRREALKAATR